MQYYNPPPTTSLQLGQLAILGGFLRRESLERPSQILRLQHGHVPHPRVLESFLDRVLSRVVEEVLRAEDGDGGFACGEGGKEGSAEPRLALKGSGIEEEPLTSDDLGRLQRSLSHARLTALDDLGDQTEP